MVVAHVQVEQYWGHYTPSFGLLGSSSSVWIFYVRIRQMSCSGSFFIKTPADLFLYGVRRRVVVLCHCQNPCWWSPKEIEFVTVGELAPRLVLRLVIELILGYTTMLNPQVFLTLSDSPKESVNRVNSDNCEGDWLPCQLYRLRS